MNNHRIVTVCNSFSSYGCIIIDFPGSILLDKLVPDLI